MILGEIVQLKEEHLIDNNMKHLKSFLFKIKEILYCDITCEVILHNSFKLRNIKRDYKKNELKGTNYTFKMNYLN